MTDRRPADYRHRDRIEQDFDRNLLVEAGAGSGKTHSLARRMAAGIAAGVYQVDHMAAVTFTRKAAAELRGRFQLALEERLTHGRAGSSDHAAGSDPAARRIQHALGNLERFFAGTIHSFCAHLLRERPVESGIAPGFAELDEAGDAQMREESWRDYITRARASGKPELLALVDAGVLARDLDDPFKVVCLYEEVEFPAAQTPRPGVDAAWNGFQQFWKALARLLPPTPDPDSKCKVLEKAHECARRVRVADPSRPQSVLEVLELWQGSSLKVTYKWWPAGNGREAQALFQAFRAETVMPFLTAWREYVYGLAVAVLTEARAHAAAERRRHNKLNYGDLLQMAARVLRENPAVRRALQQKYRWLFVDEFQDTDPVQAEIVLLLAAEEDAGAGDDGARAPSPGIRAPDWRHLRLRPGALFVVGDPKQSIYRFRRADIDIYSQVKDLIVASGGEVVPLTANFRSVASLCEWANEVFRTVLPAEATQHAPAFERLDAFREDADERRFGVRTLTVPATIADKEASEHEAQAIARFIRSEMDSGRRKPGDFLLLTRKKKRLATYASVLEQFGIPVEVSGAGAFGDSEDVQHLSTLLRALADPQDSVALVGVLRGPFFGISDPALFEHVQSGGRLWLSDGPDADAQPTEAAGEPASHAAGTGEPRPVRDALEALRRYYRWTRLLPAAAAVERILEHSGYLALAATMRKGAEAGNLLHAIDRIRQVSEDGGTLMTAVESLEEDAETGSEIDSLPLEPGRADVVRLMNLHKAKGLEADVVFLADPLGGFDPRIDVRIVREGRMAKGYFPLKIKFNAGGSRLLGQPRDWAQHEAAEQQYVDAEGDRLLYVAATRARDLLVVGRYAGQSRSKRAWTAFDPWLTAAAALEIPSHVNPAVERRIDLSDVALAHAATAREASFAAVLTPSWSITSVTAEARHISRVVRRAEGAVDDPTTTISQDAPAHRADAGMAWGTLIHGLLEHAMRFPSATRDDLRRLAMWLTVEEPQLRAVIEEALDTVERAAAADFWSAAQSHVRSMEAPFTVGDADRLTNGVIDLLFDSDEGWRIVDYKTDQSLEQDRYAAQLEAYRRALRQVGCRVAGAALVNVRLDEA